MRDPDVLVVGGGPAGSTAARLLALRGWRVLLVDRARFPRAKACGECVNPGAVKVLERLGLLPAVLDLGPTRLRGWRIQTTAVAASCDFGADTRALGISRARMDHVLLRAARDAGVSILESARVEHATACSTVDPTPTVSVRAGGTRIVFRPRLVIGADGLRSVVSRSLGLVARGRRPPRVSVTLHATGTGLPADHGVLDVRHGRTLGVAPVDDDMWNVTLVVDARRDGRLLASDPMTFTAAILRARFPNSSVVASEGPWASGPFDWPVRRSWAPGVLLVGDAAGYFDPFTGQGIYRALRSAELAADAAHRTLAAPESRGSGQRLVGDWTHLAGYDRHWAREIRWSRMVQRGVDQVMAHSSLRTPLLRRLDATGGLAQVFRVTGDADAPGTLLRPSVWTGTSPVQNRRT